MNNLLTIPPLSLYIHYPWCLKKCPYCDFNSHEGEVKTGYINALIEDLEGDLKYVQNRAIESIFIGGGTPSLMSTEDANDLIDGLKERLTFSDNVEITMEANPGTFEVEKFAEFRNIGINRLSIGVQSFEDRQLKFLGRVHSSNEAINAITEAQRVGFKNLNIDLMYGLNGQSIDMCIEDLNKAIELNPSHISFYQLTLEPNTLFSKFPPRLPSEEVIWEMGEKGANLLNKKGFRQYEVSAYSTTPSIHNLNYWTFGDYIGIGAGAHGKITDMNTHQIFRTLKLKSPNEYLLSFKKNKKTSRKKIVDSLSFEFMLNGLRLIDGFDSGLYESRTGLSIESVRSQIIKAEKLNLLDTRDNWIKPTKSGYSFLNELQEIFL